MHHDLDSVAHDGHHHHLDHDHHHDPDLARIEATGSPWRSADDRSQRFSGMDRDFAEGQA